MILFNNWLAKNSKKSVVLLVNGFKLTVAHRWVLLPSDFSSEAMC